MSSRAAATCAACGGALAHDQRYCLECGTRHAPRDPALVRILASLPAEPWRGLPSAEHQRTQAPAASRPQPERATVASGVLARFVPPRLALPGPRVGAVLTLAMLAFGTLAGAAASNPAGTLGTLRRPLTLLMLAHAPAALKTATIPPKTAVPPPVEATPTPEVPPEAPPTETPAAEPPPAGSSGEHAAGGSAKQHRAGSGSSASASKLPPVKHVFLIVLADEPSARTFGPESPAHYLAHTLERRGELLVRAYAVAREELANEIALISGLGPTPQTAADCPVYSDIIPTLPDKHGQYTAGRGCIYPVAAQTIGSQLEAKGLSWRVYAQALGNSTHAAGCWHPAFGAPDPTTALPAGERFATFRDPFDYFDGVLHGASCARDDVSLSSLARDLRSAARTPAFSYIVPDLCHDGRPTPCAPGAPTGLAAADAFLRGVVPEILASPAYRKGGLLIITSDQAPATGEYADSSSCCLQPRFPAPEIAPAATGSPGASSQAGAVPPSAAAPAVTMVPAATATPPPTATPTATTPPTATTTTPSATTPPLTAPSPAQPSIHLPPTGGGQVGALLLSPFVKPGTNNQEPLNDFTLLRTIEDLFGLPHLGYAGAKGVSSLEASVFSAYTAG